jgi:hypothetical protein
VKNRQNNTTTKYLEETMSNNKQYHIENGSEIWNDCVNPPTVEVVSYWVMEGDQMIEICDTYEEAVEYINQLNKKNEQR